jgi:hypothetical protein
LGFNYRYSIIPAGAIIDPRLNGRALQVLCLLGRHVDDNGWCRRSQTKMAEELSCHRSTIQAGLELLYETEWVERRLEGRGRTGPDETKQPFSAHSYRVRLDRDDLLMVPEIPGTQGARKIRHPGAGSDPAPLEGPLLKDTERERASDLEGPELREFTEIWPSGTIDDDTRTAAAWNALTFAERRAAIAGVPKFLEEVRKAGRRYAIAGSKYLGQRKWSAFEKRGTAAASGDCRVIDCWSREWWIELFAKLQCGDPVALWIDHASQEGRRQLTVKRQAPSQDDLATFKQYPSDGEVMAAWRPWFEARGIRFPRWATRQWVFLPSERPS